MTSTTSFLRLNALFPDDEHVEGVAAWLRTGQLPQWANKRFAANYKDFELRDGKVVYTPQNLIVVPKSKINELLTSIVDNKRTGLGKAILSMYKFVQMHYCGITREEVAAFMRRQTDYQVAQPPKNRVNKPFTADAPNALWCLDLIDLNPYIMSNKARFRYIMTIIDVFSRRVFLGKLKNKTGKECADQLQRILDRATVSPKRLLCDNGLEFANNEFAAVCEQHGIKMSHSRPHTPQSNSLVERANKEVRARLRALFIRNKSLDWVAELRVIEDNINSSYHSSIKAAPKDLWTAARELPEEPDAKMARAIEHSKKSTRAKLERYRETEFAVGDRVRVSMPRVFTNIRAEVKAGNKKNIVVQYTPEIFVVHQKIQPRDGGYSRPRYILRTLDGQQLRASPTVEAQFYASDMIHAQDAAPRYTTREALRLNQVQPSASDIQIVDG